jgi:hypothetical protein
MRRIASAIVVLLILVAGLVTAFFGFAPGSRNHASAPGLSSNNTPASEGWKLYDPDPNHVWNRLYRSLFGRVGRDGREYGYDELEPLLWSNTKYLLTSPANQQAIAILDEFLSTHAERKIRDPLKRAILQRDLWAVFDWTASVRSDSPSKIGLQTKLVQVIKRLALSPHEIAALPANYAQAVESKVFATAYDPNRREQSFLPPELPDPNGSWVALSSRAGGPVSKAHVREFSGRSTFLIFVRLPGGRDATLKYVQELLKTPEVRLPSRRESPGFSPLSLPQFPVGTQLALVRQTILIDSQGNFRPTNLVEDVQIRVHRLIPNEPPRGTGTTLSETLLDTYVFKLSRPKLFAGEAGGLRSVTRGEMEFPIFQSHGIDVIESGFESPRERETLKFCAKCHFDPGVYSSVFARGHIGSSPDSNKEAYETRLWKLSQFDWGLLQRIWQSEPDAGRVP